MKKEIGLYIIYLLIIAFFLYLFTDPDFLKALLKTFLKPIQQ